VQIRGVVQERFRQAGNWGFELKNMQLLSDLREKMAKSFTIQCPLHLLNDQFVRQIYALVESTKAEDVESTCQLKFKILDMQDELAIEMPAKSLKINLTNDFLDGLEKFEGVNYRLN